MAYIPSIQMTKMEFDKIPRGDITIPDKGIDNVRFKYSTGEWGICINGEQRVISIVKPNIKRTKNQEKKLRQKTKRRQINE